MDRPHSGHQQDDGSGPGEFEVIEQLRIRFEAGARALFPDRPVPPAGETWIGDDAAVIALAPGDQGVWATDLVVDGIHVDLDLCSLEDVGWKAIMVTVSDLAAMGARSDYALISIAAPPGTDLDLLGSGIAAAAQRAECVVVGGDLSQAPTLVVSVSVLGTLRSGTGGGPLLRSGAGPGDHLLVTGALGRSAAGLRLLRHRGERSDRGSSGSVAAGLVGAYRRPVARLRQGEVARLSGATAAIDISDGLVADLRQLGRSSGVGAALHRVPVADGATEAEALGGGEDYELLVATADPKRLVEAYRSAGLPAPLDIGSCTGRAGEYTRGGVPLADVGWRHRF